jgi:DnaJ-class molecular chaperone
MDYYEILEVSEKASAEVIERVYKVLAKKYHPDVASSDMPQAEADEKMKRINMAYETLSDPVLRAKYDQQRRRSPSR